MRGRILQFLGIFVILLSIGAWWLLDLYGCAFNTNGCSRVLPRFTGEALRFLALPVLLGLGLIILGRRGR